MKPHTSSYEPHSDNHLANTDTTTEDTVEMTADNTARTNCFYVAKLYLDGKVASDLTGRFPTTSFDGNKYIMILYSDDANGILAQPVKNRSEQELVDAIKVLHTKVKHAGPCTAVSSAQGRWNLMHSDLAKLASREVAIRRLAALASRGILRA